VKYTPGKAQERHRLSGAGTGAGSGAGVGAGAMAAKASGSGGAGCAMIYFSRFSDAGKSCKRKTGRTEAKSRLAKRGRNRPSGAYKKLYEDL